jgi:RNA polymerase sigma-70 factor (ECF subfamily)
LGNRLVPNLQKETAERRDPIAMEQTVMTATTDRNWHAEQAISWATRDPATPAPAVEGRDIAAFEAMVDQCEDKAYSLAMQLVRSEPVAQEIIQQTFLLAWQNRQKLAGGNQFNGWVYRTVGKAAIARLKSKAYQGETSAGVPVPSTRTSPKFRILASAHKESDWSARPSDQLFSEELCRYIRKTVDSLPMELRAMFILCDSEAMSLEESAAILGLPVANAKVNLQAARLAVRAAIGDYFCGDAQEGASASVHEGIDHRLLSEGSLTDP